MDFKKKLKSLMSDIRSDVGSKSPSEETLPSQLAVNPAIAKFKEHSGKQLLDPQLDKDTIASIEKEYFKNETFDTSDYELKKLQEKINPQKIIDDEKKLRRQLEAVSRKVSELVLEKHPAFDAELHKVMELEQKLKQAGQTCAYGRSQITEAKNGFTTASLGLLANYRKRQQFVSLLNSLKTIKTLQSTDIRLREMVEEEEYSGAIQLCLECQKAASTFCHYKCISELSTKLQDTLEMIEEALDVALSRTCLNFESQHYGKVQMAYKMLGKTQTAMDQLNMHYSTAIQNTAFKKVLGYVELCSGTGDGGFLKRQYSELCQFVSQECFTPCLSDLCKALWEVMKCYNSTVQWHRQHEKELTGESEKTGLLEANVNRHYIRQKLEHGSVRVWSDVQTKVKQYLLSTDLSHFKFDEFIRVLDIVNRLMLVGEEFCASKSEGLQESLRKQSLNYFKAYHRSKLDELRMFLEIEGWEPCPVRPTFTIFMLQEFKFMHQTEFTKKPLTSDGSSDEKGGSIGGGSGGYFEKFSDGGSPFDVRAIEEEEAEDLVSTNGLSGMNQSLADDEDSDTEVDDALKQLYINEGEAISKKELLKRRKSSEKSNSRAPIVTNTTLEVCRLFGKYMQMMSVLKPIAFDVTICMSQLFDYYLYTVYSFFAAGDSSDGSTDINLSARLRMTLKRIRDNLMAEERAGGGGVGTGVTEAPAASTQQEPGGALQQHQPSSSSAPLAVEGDGDRVACPHISPMVQLTSTSQLYGLAARVVATESLMFLAGQFEHLQGQLEIMIPAAKKPFLQQFYSQTVGTARELRRPVYHVVTSLAINYDNVLQLMTSAKWDIRDIMSQHSPYVDAMLQELSGFNHRLSTIKEVISIPKDVTNILWDHCIRQINRTFVEGYSSAKKCSNEGRALMQLDFEQFITKLGQLTDLRPIPDREFVDAYIKAYYLPETQLEVWIRDHKEYSIKQLVSLVTCMGHLNKKGRQKLLGMLEELEKARR